MNRVIRGCAIVADFAANLVVTDEFAEPQSQFRGGGRAAGSAAAAFFPRLLGRFEEEDGPV